MLFQHLAKPLDAVSNCGPDRWLTHGRAFLQQPLEEARKEGMELEWSRISSQAQNELAHTRDLRVAIILALAETHLRGFAGLRDGLHLVKTLLTSFPGAVHPVPDDPQDPTRVNILSNLSAPAGSDSAYDFIATLKRAALVTTATGIVRSYADLEKAERNGDFSDWDKLMVREDGTPNGSLAIVLAVIAEIRSLLAAIGVLMNPPGSKAGVLKFEEMESLLGGIASRFGTTSDAASQAGGEPAEKPAMETENPIVTSTEPTRAKAAPGKFAVSSRAEADHMLTALVDYLERVEPSSPVPYLLRRAQRLLKMNFIDAIHEFAPESAERFYTALGLPTGTTPAS